MACLTVVVEQSVMPSCRSHALQSQYQITLLLSKMCQMLRKYLNKREQDTSPTLGEIESADFNL